MASMVNHPDAFGFHPETPATWVLSLKARGLRRATSRFAGPLRSIHMVVPLIYHGEVYNDTVGTSWDITCISFDIYIISTSCIHIYIYMYMYITVYTYICTYIYIHYSLLAQCAWIFQWLIPSGNCNIFVKVQASSSIVSLWLFPCLECWVKILKPIWSSITNKPALQPNCCRAARFQGSRVAWLQASVDKKGTLLLRPRS